MSWAQLTLVFATGVLSTYAVGVASGWVRPFWAKLKRSHWSRDHWNAAETELLESLEEGGGVEYLSTPSAHHWIRTTFSTPARRVRFLWFWFEDEQCVKGLVHYGADCEGPRNKVHGGCTASVVDNLMGVVARRSTKKPTVTANLNVNYRKFVPLGSTLCCEARLERCEGRKVYVSFTVKSMDGTTTHNDGSGLFIVLRK